MEAELITLALASEEANWFRDLLYEIPPILIHVIALLQLVELKTVTTTKNPDL